MCVVYPIHQIAPAKLSFSISAAINTHSMTWGLIVYLELLFWGTVENLC